MHQKKILAALTFVAAAHVQAQGSMRIYGLLDASVTWGKGAPGRLVTLGGGNNIASRLGFAGSEDLGGGLKASFTLESGVNNDNGSGQATNTNNQTSGGGAGGGALTFNRHAWVSLQSSQLGELRLGRSFTPSYRSYLIHDPFNGGGIGTSQAAMGAIATYGHPGGLRSSNAIEYLSPRLNGFSLHASHALGENIRNGAAAEKDGNYSGLRLAYTGAKLDVGLAYATYRLAAVNDVREYVLGAKVVQGPITFHAMHTRNVTGSSGDMQGHLLGVAYRSGAVEVRASYSTSQRDNNAGIATAHARKIAVGPTYHLSPRTSAYALFGHVRNAAGAAFVPWPGTAVNTPNGTSRALAVGFVHSF